MMEIQNTQECFVMLWRRLERTRRLLGGQYKRFCIRNVMKAPRRRRAAGGLERAAATVALSAQAS